MALKGSTTASTGGRVAVLKASGKCHVNSLVLTKHNKQAAFLKSRASGS